MAKKTETFVVGDDVYQITQLGVEQGGDLYHDLLKSVGPTIRKKLGNIQELIQDGDESKTAANVGSFIIEVMENIPKDLMREMRVMFKHTTKVKVGELFLPLDSGDLFDQKFAGRISAMQSWIITCLRHNFSDFLPSKASAPSSPENQ
jgi:hypothetical protein